MIAAARVHSWEAWRMAGSVPGLYHPHHAAIITPSLHFPLGGDHTYAPSLLLMLASCLVLVSSLSTLLWLMLAVLHFCVCCWCLLTGSREIVFRLIWKPGPISQGTVQWRSSSKATDIVLIFENRCFRQNIDKDHCNSGCCMSKLRRRVTSEPEPDHIITSAWLGFPGLDPGIGSLFTTLGCHP